MISEQREREIAETILAIDERIATFNAEKTDTFSALREELRENGATKEDVAEYVGALKDAIKRRRLAISNPEKAQKADEKADLADIIFDRLSRVREARSEKAPAGALGITPENTGTLAPSTTVAPDRHTSAEASAPVVIVDQAEEGDPFPDYDMPPIPDWLRRSADEPMEAA